MSETAERTAEIVTAYLEKNRVTAADLPSLISTIAASLAGLGMPELPIEPTVEQPTASQIRKSITPDALFSFIDGGSYLMLKRHLASNGLTPNAYRAKYGLPKDYPMTAPSYSARRSELARSIGLGRGVGAHAAAPSAVAESRPGARVKLAHRNPKAIAPAEETFT